MTTNKIQNILQKAYDTQRNEWRELLKAMFKRVELFDKPTQLFDNQDNVQRGGQFGIVRLEDGKNIGLFEVEVADTVQIAKNRVALREIAVKHIDQNRIHGALVFYFNKKQSEYRLSFMARQSELTDEGSVTTETQPKRFTYILGETEPCKTAAKRIAELIAKNSQDFIGIKNIIDAFSVERLSKQFFTEYKEIHYNKFIAYLTGDDYKGKAINEPQGGYLSTVFGGNEKKHKKDAREFVKKLLGRTIFMFFLQKKGWLGCDKNRKDWKKGDAFFVQNLFKNCTNKEKFHSQYLTTLFYNALNKDRRKENDYFALTDSRVPFLNGGLFDRDKLRTDIIDFPPQYFEDLLGFFEQYNFTIDENSPDEQEVGIDPEMLGHIFENLLEENKTKGAFYTPKEIVQYMCQESLIQYLKSNVLDKNDTPSVSDICIEQLVREKKVSINLQDKNKALIIKDLLQSVKICDPAIGSGAFPIGLLQEIFHCLHLLHSHIEPNVSFDAAKTKKNIIQNSIYGVDKDGGAVDIARLRFWLALVVDEDVPQPLPNLDYKIMQGDSLLERYAGIDLKFEKVKLQTKLYEPPKKQTDLFGNILNPQISFTEFLQTNDDTVEFDITELEDKFFNSDNPALKKEIREKLETFERNFIQKRLDTELVEIEKQITKAERELKQFQKDYISKIQINDKNALSKQAKLQKALDTCEAAKAANRQALYDIQHCDTNDKPYFLWHLYFMDVFDEGGFDIVIGNPPYIKEYTNQAAFNGFRESKYYQGKMDLWYGFACELIDKLKTNGVQCFIAQNNWITSAGASKLRNKILSDTKIKSFIDFGNYKVFASAGIQTMIYLIQKTEVKLNESYPIKYSQLTNENLSEKKLISFLNFDFKTDFAKKYLFDITPSSNNEKAFTFNTNDDEFLLNNIAFKCNYKFSDKEVANGIHPHYDFVSKKIAEESGGLFKNGEGIFVLTTDELKKLDLFQNEMALIKPYYTTENFKRYYGNPKNKLWLIYTDSSFKDPKNIESYPTIKEHLDRFKDVITSDNKPYGLHRAREERFFLDEKIIVQRKCVGKPIFTYTNFNAYVSATFYVIKSFKGNHKFLTALLNSRLIEYWLRNKGKMQGNNFQIDKEPILNIPLVIPENDSIFIILVDYLLYLNDENNPQPNSTNVIIDFFERVIDGCVFELYFEDHMKERDIAILEEVSKHLINIENLKTLKEEQDAIYRSYTALKNSVVNEKLQLFAVRSPDILLPILRGGDN